MCTRFASQFLINDDSVYNWHRLLNETQICANIVSIKFKQTIPVGVLLFKYWLFILISETNLQLENLFFLSDYFPIASLIRIAQRSGSLGRRTVGRRVRPEL